jgi:hypothetical protein
LIRRSLPTRSAWPWSAGRTGDWCFFQVRVGRASKAELAYLAAMASLGAGPYRSGEIAAALGRPGPESVAPTRARLIEKGLIYSPAYGLNEFTVPHVDAAKLPARAAESFSVTVAMWPRPGSLASSCPRGHSGARVRQHRRG